MITIHNKMPGEVIPPALYEWRENYCVECRRHVELDGFKFDAEGQKLVGTFKVCGQIVYGTVIYDKTKKENL